MLIGGNSVDDDVKLIIEKGCHIVVCTPGRLEDLLTRKVDLNLPGCVKSLVSKIFIIDTKIFGIIILGAFNTR